MSLIIAVNSRPCVYWDKDEVDHVWKDPHQEWANECHTQKEKQ